MIGFGAQMGMDLIVLRTPFPFMIPVRLKEERIVKGKNLL
jgi:hypothetical protein